jgi:membrane-associated phospholipid phosphatase
MDALHSQTKFDEVDARLHRFQTWALSFACTIIAVLCSYFWADRPIAFWIYTHEAHLAGKEQVELLGTVPNPVILLAVIVFFLVGFSHLAKRPITPLKQVALACSTSVLAGEVIKDVLKWVFGRPSPDFWAENNASAAGSYGYQFQWFHGAQPFNSFPSGHMTAAAAVLTVLWIVYPQFRPIYVTCWGLVAAGLIGLNFHFLADVIAGGLLGATVALLVLAVFEDSIRRGAPNPAHGQ